jgi:hypothetical protein
MMVIMVSMGRKGKNTSSGDGGSKTGISACLVTRRYWRSNQTRRDQTLALERQGVNDRMLRQPRLAVGDAGCGR